MALTQLSKGSASALRDQSWDGRPILDRSSGTTGALSSGDHIELFYVPPGYTVWGVQVQISAGADATNFQIGINETPGTEPSSLSGNLSAASGTFAQLKTGVTHNLAFMGSDNPRSVALEVLDNDATASIDWTAQIIMGRNTE